MSNNKKRFYNVELSKTDAQIFGAYLKQNGVYFETSSADCLIHFEVLTDLTTLNTINNYLRTL